MLSDCNDLPMSMHALNIIRVCFTALGSKSLPLDCKNFRIYRKTLVCRSLNQSYELAESGLKIANNLYGISTKTKSKQ